MKKKKGTTCIKTKRKPADVGGMKDSEGEIQETLQGGVTDKKMIVVISRHVRVNRSTLLRSMALLHPAGARCMKPPCVGLVETNCC
ncbi:hypothetical protein CAEBREN_14419 [Caenorhabditis brenneri]|uniref:Uncharacterized protein n=1 Tax=Caenorhabditis brenneri TaxID=135651 RepID=G0NW20_CAEBE|nr:hypothetical protein CAEBREN_14419 [Caenorhabditis brenneri]